MNNNNYKNKILVLTILTIVFTIMGSTLAFWNWNTSEAQRTLIGFTVDSNLSCTGDGGGNITSSEKNIVPTSCTNQTYAIQRTITLNTSSTISTNDIFLSLWLDVKDIGEGLTNSKNFKYALTKQANDCTSNVIKSGSFNGVTDNDKVSLIDQKEYIGKTSDTYYLYIWLDAAEESTSTMNQSFEMSLNGNCEDEATSVAWYSYNGVEAPNINEVRTDKETYPYAIMFDYGDTFYYTDLILSAEPFNKYKFEPDDYRGFPYKYYVGNKDNVESVKLKLIKNLETIEYFAEQLGITAVELAHAYGFESPEDAINVWIVEENDIYSSWSDSSPVTWANYNIYNESDGELHLAATEPIFLGYRDLD